MYLSFDFPLPDALTNRGDFLNALSKERRDAWIKALKRGTLTPEQLKYRRICSRHFINGKPAALENRTNPDWIPNQNLGYVATLQPQPSALCRFQRCIKRARTETMVADAPPGISEAWGGRTSDKFLTENCGFLNLICPGDIVLADRGFLIKDSLNILGANLKIPAFTRGKSQLHPRDLENTRSIATVRIHVERVIGLLKKKFQVFGQTIPVSMLSEERDNLSALDKIVVVCSAFINMCPSNVPLK